MESKSRIGCSKSEHEYYGQVFTYLCTHRLTCYAERPQVYPVDVLATFIFLPICLFSFIFYILLSQHLQMTIQALKDELCIQRDLNELLQQENSAGSLGSPPDCFPYLELTEDNFHYLQAEHEQQTKELFFLRKTVEEMGQRIKSQKQTLSTRDESIKKLLDMLEEKGLAKSGLPDDEGLRVCRAEEALSHLGDILEQKEKENKHQKEVRYGRNNY